MMTREEAQARKISYLTKAGVSDIELTGANIRPSALSSLPLDKQQALIDLIRANYNAGFAFFGDPQTGKTTMANLLFKAAIIERINIDDERGHFVTPPNVWRITARALCQQAQDRATGRDNDEEFMCHDMAALREAQAKIVSRERMQRAVNAGLRPRLFIEEWDKVGLTDFRRETLFDILDAIYSMRGQLVMTSNLAWSEFCETFGKTNWRISQNCFVVELYGSTVTVTPPAVSV